LNGDTTLYFSGTSSPVRLAGQFDATAWNTGVYNLLVTVTAVYPGGISQVHSYTKSLAIVNETHSPIARGWTLAEMARLYILTSGYLITTGAGDAMFFPSLGVQAQDFSTLTYDTNTHLYTRTDVNGSRLVFNSAGFMTGAWDRRGLGTTMTYDAQNRLQYVYDPMFKNTTVSRYLLLQYGSNGLSSIQDHAGPGGTRTTLVTVGTDSNLTAIKDPDSIGVSYTYDTNKRLITETDRRGSLTSYSYDPISWKLVEVHLPQIPVDIGGGLTHDSIPVIKYQSWQTVGVPTTPTSVSLLATATLQSAIRGRVVDPRGQPSWFTPNSWGQPVTAEDTLGNIRTINYQGYLPVVIHNMDGSYDSVTYSGKLITSVRPAGKARQYFHYGVNGQVDSSWGGGTSIQRYYLNALNGNIDSIKTAGVTMNMERLTYDTLGRLILDSDPAGHKTAFHYDPIFGNADSVSYPNKAGPKVTFDAYGRDSSLRTPGSAALTLVYDVVNRPVKQYDGVANTPEQIVYDGLFVSSVQDRAGNTTSFIRNALGDVTQRCDALSACATYRYSPTGLLTSFTNRRGQRVDMTYDPLGRILSKSGMNVIADSFSYSPNGLVYVAHNNVETDSILVAPGTSTTGATTTLISWLDGARHKIVHGDLRSWAGKDSTAITANTGVTFRSRYLVVDTTTGLLVSHNDGFQTTTYTYTDERLLYTGTGSYGGKIEGYWPTHLKSGALVGLPSNLITGVERFYGYDNALRLNSLSLAGPVAQVTMFSYDSAGRFSQALVGHCSVWTLPPDSTSKSCTSGDTTTIRTYSYDSTGNWITNRGFGVGNRLLSTSFYSANYSYDADGNLTERTHSQLLWPTDSGNFLYTWSADGRLLSASREGQPAVYYDYNALGQVVRKWHGNPSNGGVVTRRYVYDRGQLIAELDAANSNHRLAEYVYETETDRPYALITGATSPSQIQYYFQDAEGNIIGLVGGTTVKQSITYSDWGVPTVIGDTTSHLFWKGLQYEPETRMYHMRNRWYSPELALFVSEDPAGFADGLNLYSFALDDPINGWDPSGLYSGDGSGFNLPVEIGSIIGKIARAHGRNLGRVPKSLPRGTGIGLNRPSRIWDLVPAGIRRPFLIILLGGGLNAHQPPDQAEQQEPPTEETQEAENKDKKRGTGTKQVREIFDKIINSMQPPMNSSSGTGPAWLPPPITVSPIPFLIP